MTTRPLSDLPLIAYRKASDRAFAEHTAMVSTVPVGSLPDVIRSYSDKREKLWAAYKARKQAFELRAFVADHGLTRVFDTHHVTPVIANTVTTEKAA